MLASVFKDVNEILLVNYLQTGKTIQEKRPDLLRKKVILLQDNDPAQTAIKTIAKITKLKYKLLQHQL